MRSFRSSGVMTVSPLFFIGAQHIRSSACGSAVTAFSGRLPQDAEERRDTQRRSANRETTPGTLHLYTGPILLYYLRLNRDAPMTPWCLPSEPPACQFSSI